MKPVLFTLAALVTTTPALAQWRSTTYTLKAGWNAIWLNGDATYLTPENHFSGQPDIVEIWRWNPNPDSVQFIESPAEPTQGTPEWSVWRRDQPQYSDLTLLTGQSAYLVKLRDGAPQQTLTLKQRVEPPRVAWRRGGANLLAFPTKKNVSSFPAITTYFSTFPDATASKIYRYNGGPLNAANPVRIVTPATERIDSTQAYWFEAKTVSDFMGPVHITTSNPKGLLFGDAGSTVTVTLRNRTNASQTLTFTPVSSESPPVGQSAIAGPVALLRQEFHADTAEYTQVPLSAPWSVTLPPGAAAGVVLTVDRTALTGPSGSLFASILRITDAANIMDVNLPVTAGSASLSGLWVGDAELTNVESKVPGYAGTATGRPFPLRWIVHVDGSGRATLLSQAFLGVLNGVDNAVGVATSESSLKADQRGSAIRLTAAHLPLDRAILAAGGFGPGGTVTGTIGLPFNDPVNPFVHAYHPDHDNRDARFNPVSAGVESWNVSRAVTFSFSGTPPPGANTTWGSRLLTGTCSETFTGLRKDPVTATGTVTFRRISDIGTLTTP